MKPSSVIKLAAILLLVAGSIFILLILLGALVIQFGVGTVLSPHPMGTSSFVIRKVPLLALSVWAIASGVGLFRLRPWARASILTLSFCAVYFFWGEAMLFLLTSTSEAPQGMEWLRFGVACIPIGMGGVASVWISQFANKRMDEVFQPHDGSGTAAHESDGPNEVTLVPVRSTTIPLAHSVIAAWLLLVWPISLYQHLFAPITTRFPFPAHPLGFALGGPPRTAYLLAITLAGPVLALGLHRAREWGRVGAAALCILTLATLFASALRPYGLGWTARAVFTSGSGWVLPASLWVLALWSAFLPAAATYFLVTRRTAFGEKAMAGVP